MMFHVTPWDDVIDRQSGVATREQLRELGLSGQEIARAVRLGLLEPYGSGVLSDPTWAQRSAGSSSLRWRQELAAAFLSCWRRNPGVVVFRRSAAALWDLDGIQPAVPELAVGSGHPRSPVVHRVRSLSPDDVQVVGGLRVTSVGRTLLDLGAVCDANIVERALESALRKRLIAFGHVAARTAAIPPRSPAGKALREVIARRPSGAPPTESDAETLFLQLSRRSGLPEPVRQFIVRTREGSLRADFAWPELRLIVEVDGAATHANAQALGRDLHRQNRLLGWTILRFTWQDIVRRPDYVLKKLREAWVLLSL
jgi:very-short-patch-repair endonuclease